MIAAAWAVRLGYTNIIRYPAGYLAWGKKHPGLQSCEVRSQLLQPGQFFPPCVLKTADRQRDFLYLGLNMETGDFSLSDVQADYVLLKYYGEFCSQCVQEVPLYNRLFAMIQKDPGLGSRIKMIGIGVGDNQRSVRRFQREHAAPYPLVADEHRIMFDAVGGSEIPLLYLVRIMPDSRVRVVFYHQGHMEDLEAFFAQIRQAVQAD